MRVQRWHSDGGRVSAGFGSNFAPENDYSQTDLQILETFELQGVYRLYSTVDKIYFLR